LSLQSFETFAVPLVRVQADQLSVLEKERLGQPTGSSGKRPQPDGDLHAAHDLREWQVQLWAEENVGMHWIVV
jgi:hypothetical protein